MVRRHRTFISALESSGVDVTLGNFKRKDRTNTLAEMRFQVRPFRRWWLLPLRNIRTTLRTHEENETDVAIACRLLELRCLGKCDAAVLITGDADIAPAIRIPKQKLLSAGREEPSLSYSQFGCVRRIRIKESVTPAEDLLRPFEIMLRDR